MCRIALILVVTALAAPGEPALGQTFSARRMAMGGVALTGGGPGSAAVNVAYRAVPAAARGASGFTLPLGLIPLLQDPPTLDPDDPDFNVYELANLAYNPPWNLQLAAPDAPSSDITVTISKDHLSVDLGEIADVFPSDHSRTGSVVNGPALGFGMRRFFLQAVPLVHYENDLSLNEALRRALKDGEPFATRTEYAMLDHARGQAAAGVQLGWAGPLVATGPEARAGAGGTLYFGARVKLLRGLAYGEADNVVAFATADTLFATDPVDIEYLGRLRDTGPEGGRLGRGLDLGLVWLWRRAQFGVGVNDLGTRIDWRVKESLAFTDSATGDFTQQVVRPDAPFTSTVPSVVTVSAAVPVGPVLIAADVVRGVFHTLGHLGGEVWLGPVALRAGGGIDVNRMAQLAGGIGLKLGGLGLDFAVASHSRNLQRERGIEFAAGLAFYSRERP